MTGMILTLISIVVIVLGLMLVSRPKKEDIKVELDELPVKTDQQIEAAEHALKKQYKEVEHKGDGKFIVDGKAYMMQSEEDLLGAGFTHHAIEHNYAPKSLILTRIK